RQKFEATLGAEDLQGMINTWEAMLVVLESGEHCPHHFRARKPH
ncbi:MAG TPA: SAM-dependent methyltransferase, partial [Rhodospirillaceae bacterium]|nr:SAM-dependent methyltransferase [Rhodospirillaceae bacterium]